MPWPTAICRHQRQRIRLFGQSVGQDAGAASHASVCHYTKARLRACSPSSISDLKARPSHLVTLEARSRARLSCDVVRVSRTRQGCHEPAITEHSLVVAQATGRTGNYGLRIYLPSLNRYSTLEFQRLSRDSCMSIHLMSCHTEPNARDQTKHHFLAQPVDDLLTSWALLPLT